MANVKKNADKSGKYVIIPRNEETYKEGFAVANRRRLPFETPVTLSKQDVDALENQKEPVKTTNRLTVYEVMEKYQVDQKKASQIVQAQAQHPDIGGTTIKWRPKFILQAV